MRKPAPKYWLYSDNALIQALNRKKKLRESLVNKITLYDLEINEIQDALRKRSAKIISGFLSK